MLIPRTLATKLKAISRKFPAVVLIGPRQSGKSTLAKTVFQGKPYISFENPDMRERAESDPRKFLETYSQGAIFDEVQRVPHLFSYLQEVLDASNKPGRFILTGSQNFMMLDKVTQSLAGRIGILRLLPFSLDEVFKISPLISLNTLLFQGGYPRLYDKKLSPKDYYPNYIATYIERDVRQITNIVDLSAFQRFLRMCAAQTGQLLNLSSLANDCGVTHKTIRSWVSVLEASFIVFLLQPHFNNFKKRLVKMPKLYFYDTGLVCALLGIEEPSQLETHPLRGPLFETFVLAELMKARLNRGLQPNLYFWRDKTGHEIDALIDRGPALIPVEVKAGMTVASDSLKNLLYWGHLAGRAGKKMFLVFAGKDRFTLHGVEVINWKMIADIPVG